MPSVTEVETRIAEQLDELLEPSRSIVRAVASLVRLCSAHAAEAPGVAASVQHSLLARTADEVAAVCCLGSYEMQAIALASSAYELGHLSAYIGADAERAERWKNWTHYDKAPWSVGEIAKGAIANAHRTTTMSPDRQYLYYRFACLAKHGNRLLQENAPAAESDVIRLLHADASFSGGQGNRAFFGMFFSAISGLLAANVCMRGLGHGSSRLAAAADDLAPRWNKLAQAFEAWRGSRRNNPPSQPSDR